jgi:predicted nucleic acid binding AN1-type Zn finger protein
MMATETHENDHLAGHINELRNPSSCSNYKTIKSTSVLKDYPDSYTWQQLFFKLCVEEILHYFIYMLDFKLFYKYLDAMCKYIPVLCIKMLDRTPMKSANYYLMAIIGRMKVLKTLKIK